MPDVFHDAVALKLFADDVKLYSKLATLSLTTPISIEEYLNKLVKWSNDWQLPISYSKCCVINLGTRNLPMSSCLMNAKSIPHVDKVIDLGVTMDRNLKFSDHVSKICCKSNSRANLILKCFYSKDTSSLLSAYKTYVRPIVECNSVVWNPFLIKDINTLEAVQRHFTKRIPEMKHLTYYQRLSKLKLESLELRRLRTDLLFAYKLVFGMLHMNVADFFYN